MNLRNVEVRSATSADLDDLTGLGIDIQLLHADGRPDLFVEPDADALRDFFRARLADNSNIFVAVADSVPVGYLFAQHSEREASPFLRASSILYVQHIAVSPKYQGSGIGTLLMNAAAKLASSLGAPTIRLDSWHFNTDAHEFFEANGFTPINIVFERREQRSEHS